MRTTISLKDEAYEVVKSLASARNVSMGDILSEYVLHPRPLPTVVVNDLGIAVLHGGQPITTEGARKLLDEMNEEYDLSKSA